MLTPRTKVEEDEEQKKLMDQEITLEELTLALHSCKMSAPGSDGVPYLVYKKLWKITGPILLKPLKHSPSSPCSQKKAKHERYLELETYYSFKF